MKKALSVFLIVALLLSLSMPALAATDDSVRDTDAFSGLEREWMADRVVTLADPAPWNRFELEQAVDVSDPGSVAAYFVWAVNRLVDDFDGGMEMMCYLFADLEPYGSGYTEGGAYGTAGWDGYFNERLEDEEFKWLPRAFFEGANADNGFALSQPLSIELYYNEPNTKALNEQGADFGRTGIVYWVMSHAGQNQVNLNLMKFEGSDRWYVANGAASAALFYDQRSALTPEELALAAATAGDVSSADAHNARYQSGVSDPTPADKPEAPEPIVFADVDEDAYYSTAVDWAVEVGVTNGTKLNDENGENWFSPDATVTRGQAVTFLWRSKGEPEPEMQENPFTDVKETDYFYKAVLWAVENGLTNGVSPTAFAPGSSVTRGQMVTFLWRTAGRPGETEDYKEKHWAADAEFWAHEVGCLGDQALNYTTNGDCPRCDVVYYLFNAILLGSLSEAPAAE